MDESNSPLDSWTLESIKILASEFPTEFANLPKHTTLTFREHKSGATLIPQSVKKNGSESAPIKWPSVITPMILEVGFYDEDRSPLHGKKVWAYVHGQTSVGYVMDLGDNLFMRINNDGPIIDDVDFDDNFNKTVTKVDWFRGKNLLRALILYLFVSAGHIQEFPRYSKFESDFRTACKYLSGTNRQSRATVKKPRYCVTIPDEDDLSQSDEEAIEGIKTCGVKRERVSRDNTIEDDGSLKKQRLHCDYLHHQQQMAKLYDQLKDENEELQKEIRELMASGDTAKDAEINGLKASLVAAEEKARKADNRASAQWKRANDLEDELEVEKAKTKVEM